MAHFGSWRVWVFGLLTWAIPFVAAFAFFDQTGTLAIAEPLFKSLMVVIGGAVGATLLVFVFRHTPPSLGSGIVIGLLWLAINLALDLAVLVPMSGTSITDYAADIGLRYLMIPIMAIAMGAVGQAAAC